MVVLVVCLRRMVEVVLVVVVRPLEILVVLLRPLEVLVVLLRSLEVFVVLRPLGLVLRALLLDMRLRLDYTLPLRRTRIRHPVLRHSSTDPSCTDPSWTGARPWHASPASTTDPWHASPASTTDLRVFPLEVLVVLLRPLEVLVVLLRPLGLALLVVLDDVHTIPPDVLNHYS